MKFSTFGRLLWVGSVPYSNIGCFEFGSRSFNDSIFRYFIFLRFWSFPNFHKKLLVLWKAFKGRFRSVPVFPYSNIGCFQFSSCSFNDSFVLYLIFLMRFWSIPDFHMKLLVLEKAFQGRFRSVPVFPNSNIGCF